MEHRDCSAGKQAVKGALLPAVAICQYDRRAKQNSVMENPSNLLPINNPHGRTNEGTKRRSD
jgi:hypothetical protein|tara:strand:+ start:959 stop:1144 length:186 start_codon:yes stop_codon:yes gene_type:complete